MHSAPLLLLHITLYPMYQFLQWLGVAKAGEEAGMAARSESDALRHVTRRVEGGRVRARYFAIRGSSTLFLARKI